MNKREAYEVTTIEIIRQVERINAIELFDQMQPDLTMAQYRAIINTLILNGCVRLDPNRTLIWIGTDES